jgi:peroxiredoxin
VDMAPYLDIETDLPVGWKRQHGLQHIEGTYHNLNLRPSAPRKQVAWQLPPTTKPYMRQPAKLLPKGAEVPLFELPTADGQHFSLEDTVTRPRITLLYFWVYDYMGLTPEKKEDWQFLNRWYHAGNTRGLRICAISASPGSNRSLLNTFQQQQAIPFPIAQDTSCFEAEPTTRARYGVESLPSLYVLDSENRVLVAHPYFHPKAIEKFLHTQGVLPDNP